MPVEDEAKTTLDTFRRHYTRTVYGTEGYREVHKHLSLESEFQLAQRRPALLVEEHSETWVAGWPKVRTR